MESISNISSEEELLQLKNEGKITEDEYNQLLETLRKTAKIDVEREIQGKPEPGQTSGLAIASLVFSVLGPIGSLPAIICGHIALRKIRKEAAVKGRGLALAGLIIGYAVLCLSILVVIPMFLLYYGLMYDEAQFSMMEVVEEHNRKALPVIEFKHYPLDNMDGLLTQSGVTIDKQISSDGNGSLRVEATEPTTIRLFETGDIDIESARLIYRARLRTEDVEGQIYLEMWCHFARFGDAFSRGLATPLTGSTEWTTEEIPFFLKKGENPDNVKLNLVINGKGTAWIDDIRLIKDPLKP